MFEQASLSPDGKLILTGSTDHTARLWDTLTGKRIGKALSNPNRLEILELLAQGERTVDSLATEIGQSLANTSQHLQALRQAALVDSRKEGLFVFYRLSDPAVFALSKAIRTVAEYQLADLDRQGRDARAPEARPIEQGGRARYAALERICRRPHRGRSLGADR